ncbi:MAG: S1 RNA-binding domain-containing protein [Sandaracinaceae bacterium]
MSEKESFADLFQKEGMPAARPRRLHVGDEVEGVVAHVGKDEVFVDLDHKQQGYFDRVDLVGPDGEVAAKLGDHLRGIVVEIDASSGQFKLATKLGRDTSFEQLQRALEGEIPVDGKITGTNKGGVEVDVGGARGFCPFSQLDVRYVENPSELVGQVVTFLVVELRDRDVVLSRRRLLENEARRAMESVLGKLQEGATMRGRVTQVRDFGAFVDLGGVEGLIAMRELTHDRSQRAEDVVRVGDVVDVKVLKIESRGPDQKDDRPRISLSLRALAADPWDGVDTLAPVGRVVAGQVTRLTDFGAFVRLAPGVEGLLHKSELGARIGHPSEAIEVGEQRLVVVREVDRARRRVSLALAPEGVAAGEATTRFAPVLGAVVKAKVDKHEHFGVFVEIVGVRGRDGRGLVPTSELGLARGADLRKAMPLGTEITAKVVDATPGRMRLSIRAAVEDAERAVFDSFRQDQSAKGSMGTLGDLLRQKLEKK